MQPRDWDVSRVQRSARQKRARRFGFVALAGVHCYVAVALMFAMLHYAYSIPGDPQVDGIDELNRFPGDPSMITTLCIWIPVLLDLIGWRVARAHLPKFAWLAPVVGIALSIGLYFVGRQTFGTPIPIPGG